MTEAAILLTCLAISTPVVTKSLYRGVAVIIADHILHESLICSEEKRRPIDCQRRATAMLRRALPWFDTAEISVHMQGRTYAGKLKIAFDETHIHRKTMNIDMDKW